MKEKINQSITKSLIYPKLYLDDLKQLEAVLKTFKKDKNQPDIKIQYIIDGYSYESIDEVEASGNVVNEFEVKSDLPYLSLRFNKFKAEMYFSIGDDPHNIGVMHTVLELSKHWERKLLNNCVSQKGNLLLFAIVLTCSLNSSIMWFKMTIFAMYFGVIFFSFWFNMNKYSTLVFSNKKDETGYFKKNKDVLITSAITGALTATISALVTYFLMSGNNHPK